MTAPVLFPMPGNDAFCAHLASLMHARQGELDYRRFPDGESYVRLDTPVAGFDVALICTLNAPDEKTLALLFAARTARELGARSVGLVAPYLAYMRQDKRFQAGEALTSAQYGALLSPAFDWLVTVDPHLHRHKSLDDLYSVPSAVVHAAPVISEWVREQLAHAVLIGPDSESEQWVGQVAAGAGCPYLILRKTRRGDRDVSVSAPEIKRWRDRVPVLIDDIISTARTMIAAAAHFKDAGMQAPVCIGVHGVFAGTAHADLLAAGAARVVTCNTIPHPTNAIDLAPALAQAAARMASHTTQRSAGHSRRDGVTT